MGKKNVFGSIEEISRLASETKCGFCIDFAHTLARYGSYDIELLKKSFPQEKWHCHFSGIEYSEKGEKNHKLTSEEEIKKLIPLLPKDKEITIINESPSPIEDSISSIKIYNKSIK
jgi:deoxyribonuclease-4